jgi:hypothetical protein
MRILYCDIGVKLPNSEEIDEKNDKRIPEDLRTPIAIIPRIEIKDKNATLLQADGMAVQWSTDNANLATIGSSNGNKATIKVVNKNEEGGYVKIKAKLTNQADIDKVYGGTASREKGRSSLFLRFCEILSGRYRQ